MQLQENFDGLEAPDLGGIYEDVLATALRAIARHIYMIIAVVTLALAVATLLVWQLPRKYSAEALVQPDLFLSEESSKDATLATIDGSSIITGEADLIRSPMIVRAVVKQLGLDRDPEFAGPRKLDWLRTAVLPLAIKSSSLERATWRVSGNLEVVNDPRSYVISVSFTASTPEKAASVANAFALEYLRAKALQRLADRLTATNRELAQQSAKYGERHPGIVQLKVKLDTIRTRLQTVANSPAMSVRDIVPNGGITPADSDPRPSSPDGFLIFGLAFALAVVLSFWLAIWLDRRARRTRQRLTAPLVRTGGVPR
jgi:uncharacterized protein involved in exopolysaccharide biosynthesis